MPIKNFWIHLGFFICFLIALSFSILWYFCWPEGESKDEVGFIYFLIRYGHSFVWILISAANVFIWIQFAKTGSLSIPKTARLIYEIAGFAYLTFVIISFLSNR
ncbi:hypothetical protein LEP1GSC195_0630 [Leptospira wolbachii serovar Codice str. CDC]|uniref:Uncharacterized protein n=1 Tax=Leptospira wolbachii serovar Codice str. CDC TaxID=1218599 RepID=R9A954_9LEPT|nr:hypothetical protein [Leptospira wolbachii]EOQ98584.1 hypothetical protein LEP1GSC195_0630 [Leptospira wolbachii serovar Codice str. CDC]